MSNNPDQSKKKGRPSLIAIATAISATVAGLALLLTNTGTIIEKISDWLHPDPGSAQVSYTRLYGGFQIPAIMFRTDWLPSGTIPENPEDQATVVAGLPNFRSTLVQWDSTQLSKAVFALGPVGESISRAFRSYQANIDPALPDSLRGIGDSLSALTLSTDSLKLLYRYIEPWLFRTSDSELGQAERMLPAYDPGMRSTVVSEAEQRIEAASQRVGYLFLTVENSSPSSPLSDVRLEYRIYRSSSFGRCVPSADRLVPAGASAEEDTMRLGQIKPGGILLLPLAVFRADEDKFPASFCSSVIAPHRLSWREGRRTKQMRINAPGLASSARELLPFRMGWYHQ